MRVWFQERRKERGGVKVWVRSVAGAAKKQPRAGEVLEFVQERTSHLFPEEECPAGCFGNCASPFSSCRDNTNVLERLQSPAGSPR